MRTGNPRTTHVYWADPSETDQGVTGGGKTLYALAQEIGISKKATIVLPHFPREGDETVHTLTTSLDLTTYPYLTLKFQDGAIVDGAGVLTAPSPKNIRAGRNQKICESDFSLVFATSGTIYPEWWGAIADDSTDSTVAWQSVITLLTVPHTVLPAGTYKLTDKLTFPETCIRFTIKGDPWFILKQYTNNTQIFLMNDGLNHSWTIKNLTFQYNTQQVVGSHPNSTAFAVDDKDDTGVSPVFLATLRNIKFNNCYRGFGIVDLGTRANEVQVWGVFFDNIEGHNSCTGRVLNLNDPVGSCGKPNNQFRFIYLDGRDPNRSEEGMYLEGCHAALLENLTFANFGDGGTTHKALTISTGVAVVINGMKFEGDTLEANDDALVLLSGAKVIINGFRAIGTTVNTAGGKCNYFWLAANSILTLNHAQVSAATLTAGTIQLFRAVAGCRIAVRDFSLDATIGLCYNNDTEAALEVLGRIERTVATIDTDGVGEDDLETITLVPAQMREGVGLKLIAGGTCVGANDAKTLKLHWGGVSYTVMSQAAGDQNDWVLEMDLLITATASQRLVWKCVEADGTTLAGYEAGSQNTLANVILKLTGECVNALDTLSSTYWRLEYR